jgi:hypothetical protein
VLDGYEIMIGVNFIGLRLGTEFNIETGGSGSFG